MEEKDDKKTQYDKWKPIIENQNLFENNSENWLEQYSGSSSNNFLPIAKQVISTDISGVWVEPEERIYRRDRTLKLKRVLGDKRFFEIISKESYDEIMEVKKTEFIDDNIIAVTPMSTPSCQLFYMDYNYSSGKTNI
jgi:hypothetical protein